MNCQILDRIWKFLNNLKRMDMKTKKNRNLTANLSLLLGLPVIAAMLLLVPACNRNSNSAESGTEIVPPPPPPPPPVADSGSDEIYSEADEMPVFKGGDAGIMEYIKANVRYPEPAKVKGIQGKVIVRFAVGKDGNVSKVEILKGVDPELDIESVRVVSSLPAFEKPAMKDGKKVAVWYVIPINFALK